MGKFLGLGSPSSHDSTIHQGKVCSSHFKGNLLSARKFSFQLFWGVGGVPGSNSETRAFEAGTALVFFYISISCGKEK